MAKRGKLELKVMEEPAGADPSVIRPRAGKTRPKYREGTTLLACHLPDAKHRQFKALAAEQGRTVQELLEDAIADLLAKYKRG